MYFLQVLMDTWTTPSTGYHRDINSFTAILQWWPWLSYMPYIRGYGGATGMQCVIDWLLGLLGWVTDWLGTSLFIPDKVQYKWCKNVPMCRVAFYCMCLAKQFAKLKLMKYLKCDILNLFPIEAEGWSRHQLLWWPAGCNLTALGKAGLGPVSLTAFCPQFKFDGNFALP